jgi:hypothetical protein
MQHGRSGEQKSSVSILVQLFSIFRPIAAELRSGGRRSISPRLLGPI